MECPTATWWAAQLPRDTAPLLVTARCSNAPQLDTMRGAGVEAER